MYLWWLTSFLFNNLLRFSISTGILRYFTQVLNILSHYCTCIRVICVDNMVDVLRERFSISIDILNRSCWATSLFGVRYLLWSLLQSLIELYLLRIECLLHLTLMNYLDFLGLSSILNLNFLWHWLLLNHIFLIILFDQIIIQNFNGWILNEKIVNVVIIYDISNIWLYLLHLWGLLHYLLLGSNLSSHLVNSSLLVKVFFHYFIINWNLLINLELWVILLVVRISINNRIILLRDIIILVLMTINWLIVLNSILLLWLVINLL